MTQNYDVLVKVNGKAMRIFLIKRTKTMFEKASRLKLRFRAQSGSITAEDLWDLSLTQLDNIAVFLNRELRGTEDSFLETRKDQTLELRFNIVKHVLDVKKAELHDAKQAKADAERRQVLLAEKNRRQLNSIANC